MPRHSPCALFSLTCVEETRSIPFPSLDENFISAPSFSSFLANPLALGFARRGTGVAVLSFFRFRFRDHLVLCLNYAGNLTGFRNCNCYPSIRCSTIKTFFCSPRLLSERPLCCLAYHFSFSLFSFQGTKFQSLLRSEGNIQSLECFIPLS